LFSKEKELSEAHIIKEALMALCKRCGAIVEGAYCFKCETPIGAADSSAPRVPHQLNATPQDSVYRKRSQLWWILGGCLALVGFIIAFWAANSFFREAGIDTGTNKNKQKLSEAEKRTDTNTAMNVEDFQNGKLASQDNRNNSAKFQTEDKSNEASVGIDSSEHMMDMDVSPAAQLPVWLPAYPGAKSSGSFDYIKKDSDFGAGAFKSVDPPEKIISFYESSLANSGFKLKKTTAQVRELGSVITLEGVDSGTQRTAQVTAVAGEDGLTNFNLVFGGGITPWIGKQISGYPSEVK
jgi:hypothetical protein